MDPSYLKNSIEFQSYLPGIGAVGCFRYRDMQGSDPNETMSEMATASKKYIDRGHTEY